MSYTSHYSVLLNECISYLKESDSDSLKTNILDCTFGGGGHTFALAKEFPGSTVYATDQDPDALENGWKRIKDEGQENIQLLQMNFEMFPEWFKKNHPDEKLSGVIMDLGVSSHHFDEGDRGFSYRFEARLDMRMAKASSDFISAHEVVNNFDEEELANIIFKYGEERFSRKIAANICDKRKESPIETTTDLENIIFHTYPAKMRHGRTHPATKTFQALRIFVNRELEVLENTIEKLFELLETNGRIAIISFHSLEDRIVKHKYKEISQKYENTAKIITKKPVLPGEKELSENKRSRSAKLRVLEKCVQGEGYGKNKYKKKKYKELNNS
jgi:16S rRNA (cytosine1402-N4)-methyltransferase